MITQVLLIGSFVQAIDEILREPYDFTKVKPCIESKVFGINLSNTKGGDSV